MIWKQRSRNKGHYLFDGLIPYILPLHSPLLFQLVQKVAVELFYSVVQTLQGEIQNH